jgi:hypothetical protein
MCHLVCVSNSLRTKCSALAMPWWVFDPDIDHCFCTFHTKFLLINTKHRAQSVLLSFLCPVFGVTYQRRERFEVKVRIQRKINILISSYNVITETWILLCAMSGFRRGGNQKFALLGCYAASAGSCRRFDTTCRPPSSGVYQSENNSLQHWRSDLILAIFSRSHSGHRHPGLLLGWFVQCAQ